VPSSYSEDEKQGWIFTTGCSPAPFQRVWLPQPSSISTAGGATLRLKSSQPVAFLETALFQGCGRSKEIGKSHTEYAQPATRSRNVETRSA